MAKTELLSFQLIGNVCWTRNGNDEKEPIHEEFPATEKNAPDKARSIVMDLQEKYGDRQNYELMAELRMICPVLRITSLTQPDKAGFDFPAYFKEKKL